MISREEAETNPHRTILTSALGTNPDLVMDTPGQPEPLRPKDVLLICSDGLWGQVRDPEILAAVENKSVEQAGRELIRLARESGGPGKITVRIFRMRYVGFFMSSAGRVGEGAAARRVVRGAPRWW